MLDSFERCDELHETSLFDRIEKLFKKEYREGWHVVDLVFLSNEKKWLIKWKRNPIPIEVTKK